MSGPDWTPRDVGAYTPATGDADWPRTDRRFRVTRRQRDEAELRRAIWLGGVVVALSLAALVAYVLV